MQKSEYDQLLSGFKDEANGLLLEHMPEHHTEANAIIQHTLNKEQPKLFRWFRALRKRVLTVEEFISLFVGLKNAFNIKRIRPGDASPENTRKVRGLLLQLLQATVSKILVEAQKKRISSNILK